MKLILVKLLSNELFSRLSLDFVLRFVDVFDEEVFELDEFDWLDCCCKCWHRVWTSGDEEVNANDWVRGDDITMLSHFGALGTCTRFAFAWFAAGPPFVDELEAELWEFPILWPAYFFIIATISQAKANEFGWVERCFDEVFCCVAPRISFYISFPWLAMFVFRI